MKLQRVDLFGSAWQTNSGAACPEVYGDVTRDLSTVTAVRVGCHARSTGIQANAYEVTGAADSVVVERLPGEAFFDGLDPSLIARVAQMHGTGRPWALLYGG